MADILIVEDSRTTAASYAYKLWEAGHTVRFATDGRASLNEYRRIRPDLVLLDQVLPDITGLEVYQQLRLEDPRALVIMITGRGSEYLAVQALKDGVRDYLVKNDSLLESLERVVAQILREEEIRRALMEKDWALRRAHATLEERVKERTAQLAEVNKRLAREIEEREKVERALRQAQKVEALGTLASGVAHDFNNILAAMISHVELALPEAASGTPLHDHLIGIYDAGLRAADLVRRILTFTRGEETTRQPIPVAATVREALKLLRATLPASIEIRDEISMDGPVLMADATELHQVVINLGSNAGQAMRAKGGVLTVGLSSLEVAECGHSVPADLRPGPYLALMVNDTGHGIDPNIRDRIFEPYFTTREVGEGTGLGLATVHGIVKGCGGGITVASEPGKGTTFKVYLPQASRSIDNRSATMVPAGGGSERILLVDDEEALIPIQKQLLEKLGYSIQTATNPLTALNIVRANPSDIDLVITDQTMPAMSGIDLAQELLSLRPNLPIILLTGFAVEEMSTQARSIGVRQVMTKPCTIRQMAETIRHVLGE